MSNGSAADGSRGDRQQKGSVASSQSADSFAVPGEFHRRSGVDVGRGQARRSASTSGSRKSFSALGTLGETIMHQVSANYTLPTILNTLQPAAVSGLKKAVNA